jgi:NADPH:quinone reductase
MMTRSLAVRGASLGAPETYQLVPFDPGRPGPGEVRFRIRAAAVNFVDVLVATGQYQIKPPTPFIPGAECAGEVVEVGAGVTHLKPGDRVLTSRMGGGAFATVSIAKAEELIAYPDTLTYEEAATFKVSFTTAYLALTDRGSMKSGETVLVLGAAGGVGHAAIQIAKALGAVVIASASTQEKRDLTRAAGADMAIDARSGTWRDDLRAVLGGRRLDIIIDPVGAAASEPAFRSLGWRGRHLVIGFAGGSIPKIPANLALVKGISLIGVDIRQFMLFEPDQAARNIAQLFELHAAHDLKPHIGRRFALADFAEAMTLAASGTCTGRIVLTMN